MAVAIDDVEAHEPGTVEGNLEVPGAGEDQPGYSIALGGWALGADVAVEALELVAEGSAVARIPVDGERPDIAAARPGVPDSGRSGFRAAVGALDLPRTFVVEAAAALSDGARVPLWTLRGRRDPVLDPRPDGPRPLIVRGLGRTGSTWLTRLLGEHPEVVTYRPFAYEPRLLSYWIELLRALCDPREGLRVLRPSSTAGRWLLRGAAPPEPLPLEDVRVADALLDRGVRELAAFGRNRVDSFYEAVASERGKPLVAFAEKGAINDARFMPPARLAQELYPRAREILLVRDPRDMVCSMLAYDERRGGAGFGRDNRDDPDWLLWLAEVLTAMTETDVALGERSLLIRYEDLMADPETVMARAFAHAGVDSAPDAVRAALDAAAALPVPDRHRTAGTKDSSVGRWRREMPPDLRREVDAAFGEPMALHGYEQGP